MRRAGIALPAALVRRCSCASLAASGASRLRGGQASTAPGGITCGPTRRSGHLQPAGEAKRSWKSTAPQRRRGDVGRVALGDPVVFTVTLSSAADAAPRWAGARRSRRLRTPAPATSPVRRLRAATRASTWTLSETLAMLGSLDQDTREPRGLPRRHRQLQVLRTGWEGGDGRANGETGTIAAVTARSIARSSPVGRCPPTLFGVEQLQVHARKARDGSVDTQAGIAPVPADDVAPVHEVQTDASPVRQRSDPLAARDGSAEEPALQPPPRARRRPLRRTLRLPRSRTSTIDYTGLDQTPARKTPAIGVASCDPCVPAERRLLRTSRVPIFNLLAPPKGEPARFGFEVCWLSASVLDSSVRTGSDYGVTVHGP